MFLLNHRKTREDPLAEWADVVVSSICPKQKSQSCRSMKNTTDITVLICTEPRLTWRNHSRSSTKGSRKICFPKQMCTWKRIRTTANQHHCWSGCLKSFPFSWCFAPWLQLSHRQKAARSRSSAAATHSSSAAANGPFLCYKWHTRAVCHQHALCSQQSQAKAPCWLPPLFSLRLIPAVLICMTGDNHYLHYACHLSFPIYSISIIKNTLLSYKNRGVGGDKH